MAKALDLDVLRPYYDCTNGGISSRYRNVLVLCKDGNNDVDLDNPPENLVVLHKRSVFGREYYVLQPYACVSRGCVGWMAGGNYAESCDSRWSRMIGNGYFAVAIHDRQESSEQYASYD